MWWSLNTIGRQRPETQEKVGLRLRATSQGLGGMPIVLQHLFLSWRCWASSLRHADLTLLSFVHRKFFRSRGWQLLGVQTNILAPRIFTTYVHHTQAVGGLLLERTLPVNCTACDVYQTTFQRNDTDKAAEANWTRRVNNHNPEPLGASQDLYEWNLEGVQSALELSYPSAWPMYIPRLAYGNQDLRVVQGTRLFTFCCSPWLFASP